MAATLDPANMRLVKTVAKERTGFWCAALDAACQRLYAGGTDGAIHDYELPAVVPGKRGPFKGHDSYVTALAYVANQHMLVSGSWDQHLAWWNPADAATRFRRTPAGARVNQLAASADGRFLAAACDDRVARLWDTASGTLLRELAGGHPPTTLIGRKNTLYAVAFSPDGAHLATGDRAGTICLWETATGKQLLRASGSAFYSQAASQARMASEYEWGGVRCLAFAPNGKMLLAGGMGPADQNSAGIDGLMRLEAFDTATGKSLAAFMNVHKGMLTTMRFHPAGDWVAAGGGGGKAGSSGVGSLWLWQPGQVGKDGKPVPPIMHASAVVIREMLFSPDGTSLLAVGMLNDVAAGRIEVWDLSGAKK
jgi:WD40 repeat protein